MNAGLALKGAAPEDKVILRQERSRSGGPAIREPLGGGADGVDAGRVEADWRKSEARHHRRVGRSSLFEPAELPEAESNADGCNADHQESCQPATGTAH